MTFEEIKTNIDFKSINELRLKNKRVIDRRSSIYLLICLIIYIGLIVLIWPHVGFIAAFLFPLIAVALLYGILHRLFIHKYELQFKKGFRESVLDILLKGLGYDLKLNIEKPLTQSDFLKGKLFTSFNDYSSEELFEGTIENIPMKFSEVHLQSKSRYRSHTVFRGFYSNFNYGVNNDLVIDVIRDDSGDREFLQKLNLKRDKLVKIDNHDFEKIYVVYSNQPELASELLSASFIDNLSNLSNNIESVVYFSVRNSFIHVAYNDGIDHFVIDHNKNVEELTENFYSDITKTHDRMVKIKSFIDSNIISKVEK
jgi:uncharacterized membrane protein (DUF485 family)